MLKSCAVDFDVETRSQRSGRRKYIARRAMGTRMSAPMTARRRTYERP
jgi:hypothetical protein